MRRRMHLCLCSHRLVLSARSLLYRSARSMIAGTGGGVRLFGKGRFASRNAVAGGFRCAFQHGTGELGRTAVYALGLERVWSRFLACHSRAFVWAAGIAWSQSPECA